MITPEFEKHARNEYSQFGEDGIIEKILSTLLSTDNWCTADFSRCSRGGLQIRS